MSVSRLPLETVDREEDRAQPAGLGSDEAGSIAAPDLEEAGDGLLKEERGPASLADANGMAPRGETEQAPGPSPEANGVAGDHEPQPIFDLPFPEPPPTPASWASDAAGPMPPPEANGAAVDDAQEPMLDLRIPEPPPAPADWPAEIAEPVSPLVPAPRLESLYVLPTEPPSDPFGGHASPPAETLMPAESLMEVSPIFSALDAAEMAATEARLVPAPAAEPVEYVIPLPHTPALEDQPPEVPTPLGALHPIDEAATIIEDSPPAEDSLAPAPPEEQPEPAAQLHGAAAKIAEEANATAEALENLKRLLNHRLPLLDTAPILAPAPIPARPAAPPSIPAYQAPPQPVSPPPMIPLAPMAALEPLAEMEPVRRRSGVGGFLAGFALSWVFGAMLYAYLTLLG